MEKEIDEKLFMEDMTDIIESYLNLKDEKTIIRRLKFIVRNLIQFKAKQDGFYYDIEFDITKREPSKEELDKKFKFLKQKCIFSESAYEKFVNNFNSPLEEKRKEAMKLLWQKLIEEKFQFRDFFELMEQFQK